MNLKNKGYLLIEVMLTLMILSLLINTILALYNAERRLRQIEKECLEQSWLYVS
ncbi:MAG: prepilin-type N-terminal cleavage/methylation domain-containing protein [Erysipelotrichaceae bacterium]|nr:prepilin-type N-terminal cleavage/methylation domain-containing protein [Erysipelotrichaceae bacterium]